MPAFCSQEILVIMKMGELEQKIKELEEKLREKEEKI